jgi:membrane-bound lytic murein transglycosylase MltF
MKFIDTNNDEVVLNIPHITRMEKVGGAYLIMSFGDSKIIFKDNNSDKLFEYMQAKASKDILGVQSLDTMQSKINDMLANLKLPKHD